MPIIILPWPVPTAKHGVNIGVKVQRIFLPVNVVVSIHDRLVFEVIIVTVGPLPPVRSYPRLDDIRTSRKNGVDGWQYRSRVRIKLGAPSLWPRGRDLYAPALAVFLVTQDADVLGQ